jgi:hypothetical protein
LNEQHLRHTLSSPYSTATNEEDWTNEYPIAPKYKDLFDDIAPRWRATPLPAFNTSGTFIKVHEQEFTLRGSLALVYFQLRHYPIRSKRNNGIAGNTFSATVTQVKILERGAERRSSPYKSQLLKGPISLPQSPSKKKDQTSAVLAFHPGTVVLSSLMSVSNPLLASRHDGHRPQRF